MRQVGATRLPWTGSSSLRARVDAKSTTTAISCASWICRRCPIRVLGICHVVSPWRPMRRQSTQGRRLCIEDMKPLSDQGRTKSSIQEEETEPAQAPAVAGRAHPAQRSPGASVAEYKRDARIAIKKLGYQIIANVGDQESDLALEHADRTFKYPIRSTSFRERRIRSATGAFPHFPLRPAPR